MKEVTLNDGVSYSQAIDHILIKNETQGSVLCFDRTEEAYIDPLTDHYPLFTRLAFD